MVDRVASRLDLNEEQKKRLGVVADKLREQRQAVMGQGGDPRAQVRALVAGEKFDRAAPPVASPLRRRHSLGATNFSAYRLTCSVRRRWRARCAYRAGGPCSGLALGIRRNVDFGSWGCASVQTGEATTSLTQGEGLTQAAAARQLGIAQPDVSELKNYKLGRISSERLLHFMNRDVEIFIRPRAATADPLTAVGEVTVWAAA